MTRLVLKALVFIIVLHAYPNTTAARTAAEVASLPPYCAGRYARNTNPAEYKRWESQYGPDFLHVHHLCDGIIALRNAYKTTNVNQRKGALDEAIGNLNYMIQHARPDFKLMSEVYWYRAQAYNLQGQSAQALNDLRKAIAQDTKQARFYTQAADLMIKTGLRSEALALVTEGLRHIPTSKALQDVYIKLGGSLPYPDPYPQASTESVRSSSSPQDSSTPGSPAGTENKPRTAIIDLSRNIGAARKVSDITNAGAHILVEIKEDLKNPRNVNVRITSQIPQPAARITRIGIDTGRYDSMIEQVEVNDAVLGRYYPIKRVLGNFEHAYWGGFSADYMAEFTIDANEGKKYDPRALPPGSSLNFVIRLAPSVRFDDFYAAIRHGLSGPEGIRFAVIAHHLMGYRPDPTKTIMDDAGFVSGRLRLTSGFEDVDTDKTNTDTNRPTASASSGERNASVRNTDTTQTRNAAQVSAPELGPSPSQGGTLKNPWCRFCPEPSER